MPVFAEFEVEHVAAAAALHRASLAGDFLPSLGENFLRVLYKGMLELRLAWGWVALERGEVVGFVVATDDSRRFFGQLIRGRVLSLSWAVARALLRRPRLLFPTLETFLYPARGGAQLAGAELLVIVVRSDQRSGGIGAGLVRRLDESMAVRCIASYKVTVRAGNERANRFYGRLGFELATSFPMYHQQWNLYRKARMNALAAEVMSTDGK